jgi:hypothetical protein
VEPAGDHQVDDEEEPALEREHDALSDPPQALDLPARGLRERRIHRAEKKRAPDPHGVQPPLNDPASSASR